MQRFQSILQFKKVSCKNCYKCVRNCPVKAIRVHDHQARIIESQCIYCEKCILVCPQDAKEEQNMIPAICNAMENKDAGYSLSSSGISGTFWGNRYQWNKGSDEEAGICRCSGCSRRCKPDDFAVQSTFCGAERAGSDDLFGLSCNRTACQETLSASSGKSGTVCLYDAVSCQLSEKKISEGRDCLCKSLYFSYVRVERLRK